MFFCCISQVTERWDRKIKCQEKKNRNRNLEEVVKGKKKKKVPCFALLTFQ